MPRCCFFHARKEYEEQLSPEKVETVVTHVTKCPASNGQDGLLPIIRTALPSVLSILFQQK